jgi:hypothetical protein
MIVVQQASWSLLIPADEAFGLIWPLPQLQYQRLQLMSVFFGILAFKLPPLLRKF